MKSKPFQELGFMEFMFNLFNNVQISISRQPCSILIVRLAFPIQKSLTQPLKIWSLQAMVPFAENG
jgi:hypothetical protein